jgi:hypothetical protein
VVEKPPRLISMPKKKASLRNKYSALSTVEDEKEIIEVMNVETRQVGAVQTKRWKSGGTGKVTIDSGAEESCGPEGLLTEVPITDVKRKKHFVSAHYNEKNVVFRNSKGSGLSSMT